MGLYRSQDAGGTKILANIQQIEQPIFDRKLIIINKCDKVSDRLLQRFVSGQRDVFSRLHTVDCAHRRPCSEIFHDSLSGLLGVVIGDHNGVLESSVRALTFQLAQQPIQQCRALKRTYTNRDVLALRIHLVTGFSEPRLGSWEKSRDPEKTTVVETNKLEPAGGFEHSIY